MTRHSALCAAVRRLLESYSCLSFPVKQMATPVKGKPGVYCRGALRAGVADVIACGPRGRFVSVEVKIGRDKLRPAQEEFLCDVKARGGVGLVAHDTVDVVIEAKDAICARLG